MGLFEGLEIADEGVIFGVADFGLVENVVLVFVVAKQVAESRGAGWGDVCGS
jgi:hypothetical protein